MSIANTVCLCGGDFSTQVMMVQHANDQGHLLRCSCHRLFATLQDLQNHEQDAHPQDIGSFEVLELMQTPKTSSSSPSAHTCTICHSTLANEHGLAMHRAAKHPSCPVCRQSFPTALHLEGHQQATLHCYCAEHSLSFASNVQLQQHIKASPHVTGFECTSCNRALKSEVALLDHLNSEGHANVERAIQAQAMAAARAASNPQRSHATPEEELEKKCHECDRSFRTINGLYQHLKHNPLSDLRCPMSEECTRTFTSPSALLFHLEGGKCKSGMNRAQVDMLVHQHDTERQITNLANVETVSGAAARLAGSLESSGDLASLLTALSIQDGSTASDRVTDISDLESGTSDNDQGLFVFTPTASTYSRSRTNSLASSTVVSSRHTASEWASITAHTNAARANLTPRGSSPSPTIMTPATERQDWSCPEPGCEKFFRQQHSLSEHLNSPAHAVKLYHCPTGLALPADRRRTKSFKTMSGILQHLEAGACAGGREALDQIFALLEDKVTQVTGTTVRLLQEGSS